ncbi:Tubulin specific chaperone D [Spironucleus salmonicida]|uniref:Tubulin specific chaperone D n=1 Tax=Spironucleus salmonicida TaxID=348837 RepID=V6LY89_9EUKA|nr:Tubulin specific chaperone D [Spironucleus salmonicida]|eukprot:EST45764.1 Tubulin specific chaperone D [Spironucleus salmonicida]
MNQPKELLDVFQQMNYSDQTITSQISRGCKFDEYAKKFLEKPQQIDSIIKELLEEIIIVLSSQIRNQYLKNIDYFMFLYSLLQIRGNQVIQSYFPNDVQIFEKLLNYFSIIDKFNFDELNSIKETLTQREGLNFDVNQNLSQEIIQQQLNYVVLSWLNVMSMTPLNLDTIGNFTEQIKNILTKNFSLGNKISQISVEVFSRFITRPDLINTFGVEQFEIYKNLINQSTKPSPLLISAFQLFSYAIRFMQIDYYTVIDQPNITKFTSFLSYNNILLTKIIIIYSSRRAQKMLLKTFRNEFLTQGEELAGFNVEPSFDALIHLLLISLSSDFQEIRQIAAISLVSLTKKLPRIFANEVIAAVLDLIQAGETAETQSGAILCVGEMLRNRLINCEDLVRIFNILIDGLTCTFKGCGNVKDSCCYCLWSLARSYSDIEIGKQNFIRIQGNLLAVACLDSEILVRRAAGAAYQELSGRHNEMFIEGVVTSSMLDYYSLGNIVNSYNIAKMVVSLVPDIENIVLYYLVNIYSFSSNIEQRKLAGKVFSQLKNQSYYEFIQQVLKNSDDWVEICQCLELLQYYKTDANFYQLIQSAEQFIDINNSAARLQFIDIVASILKKLILNFSGDLQLNQYCQLFITQNIEFYVRQSFANISVTSFQDSFSGEIILLGRCLKQQDFDFDNTNISNIIAMQYQNKDILYINKTKFFQYLIQIMKTYKDAQNYIQRIFVLEILDYYNKDFDIKDIDNIITIINLALGDYSNDSRGDIGAQVRTKAYITLTTLNETHQEFNLSNTYKLAFIEFMHSRIEFLRLTAAKRLYYDTKNQYLVIELLDIVKLDMYTGLYTLDQQQNVSDEQQFDMNNIDDEQIKLLMNQADHQILQKGFELCYDLFGNTQFKNALLQNLIFCFGNASPKDEDNMFTIIKNFQPSEILTICTDIFQQNSQVSYVAQLQLAATQLLSQFLYKIDTPADAQITKLMPLVFNIIKNKATQLKHVQFLTIFLSECAKMPYQSVKNKALKGLIMLTGAKSARNREYAVAGLINCLEYEFLEKLCSYDWLNSSVDQASQFKAEFSQYCQFSFE